MEEMPEEWLNEISEEYSKFFSKEQIQNTNKVAFQVVRAFDGIDVLDISNIPFKTICNCLKKLDFIYYQNTGDEDAIGKDYIFKAKALADAISSRIKHCVKIYNLDPVKDQEELKEKVFLDICQTISFAVLSTRKE